MRVLWLRHCQRSGGGSASDQEGGGKGRQLATSDLENVSSQRTGRKRGLENSKSNSCFSKMYMFRVAAERYTFLLLYC